ncbi:MAG: hypothetical protein WCJ51_02245 [Candidatus Moraniibacteriota bacterium]
MNSAEQILYPPKKEPELALVKAGQEGAKLENQSAMIIEFPQSGEGRKRKGRCK